MGAANTKGNRGTEEQFLAENSDDRGIVKNASYGRRKENFERLCQCVRIVKIPCKYSLVRQWMMT